MRWNFVDSEGFNHLVEYSEKMFYGWENLNFPFDHRTEKYPKCLNELLVSSSNSGGMMQMKNDKWQLTTWNKE